MQASHFRLALTAGLLGLGLTAVLFVDKTGQPGSAPVAGATPEQLEEPAFESAAGAQVLMAPTRSAAEAESKAPLPAAPRTVASLSGFLNPSAVGRPLAVRVLGSSGVLAEGVPNENGRFQLEVEAQLLPSVLEIEFEGSLRARLGPFDLKRGSRASVVDAPLPERLAERSGLVPGLCNQSFDLAEAYGSTLLLQSVRSDEHGGFRFLAARAGPFELYSLSGLRLQGKAASADPLQFEAIDPSEANPVLSDRAEPWKAAGAESALGGELDPSGAPSQDAGTAQLRLVDSSSRGVAGLELELTVETQWISEHDPLRPPLPSSWQQLARTDASGLATWSGLPAGPVRVRTAGDFTWLGLPPLEGQIEPQQRLDLGVLRLASSAHVSGTCRDAHGRALLGARVRLRHGALTQPLETFSDEQGAYDFPLAPLGAAQIELSPPIGFSGLGRFSRSAAELGAGQQRHDLALGPEQ